MFVSEFLFECFIVMLEYHILVKHLCPAVAEFWQYWRLRQSAVKYKTADVTFDTYMYTYAQYIREPDKQIYLMNKLDIFFTPFLMVP